MSGPSSVFALNLSAADRSASSGSTFSSRALATTSNSRSPTDSKSSASTRSPTGTGRPAEEARRSSLRAYSGLGRFSGTSPKMPGSRPSSPRLISSQFWSTSPAVVASTSPNTCGWRRISFVRQCSATAAKSPWPRSSSRSDRNTTWNRTSPSSSSSLRSSPRSAASASSYASSTVCATIERSSCSRSQGHSTRRRRVISSRRVSASPDRPGSLTGGSLRTGGRRGSAAATATARRNRYRLRRPARSATARATRRDRHLLRRATRGRRTATGDRRRTARRRGVRLRLRRVLALLDDVALGARRHVLRPLLPVLHEIVQRLLLLLGLEQVLDRRLHLREGLLLRRRDLRDAEDVEAELRLDRADHLVLRRAEDRGVEGLLLLALRDARQAAALRLRGCVRRVLLRDLRPLSARLDRLERGVRLRLLGGEHDL